MKLLLPLVLLLSCTQCRSQRMRCKDPPQANLRNKLLRVAPDYLVLTRQESLPDVKPKKCPTTVNNTAERMQDRSISPWSYRINEDLTRYPQKIVEAYCLCKGCVTSKESFMVSEPFYKEVPVLYKSSKCKKSKYIYKLNFIKIAQFCICRFL